MKCVYCLDFPDGKRYVGSTKDLEMRVRCHKNPGIQKKCNPELKEAILQGGYEVIVLEQCPDNFTKDQLWAREQHYINLWWDYGILYNKYKNARGTNKGGVSGYKGKKHSAEAKAKIGAAQKGKPKSPHTEEAKAKMSAAKKGKPSNRKGKKHSEETKANMSAARLGEKRSPAWQHADEIKALSATGLALSKIAKKYNCFINIINKILAS